MSTGRFWKPGHGTVQYEGSKAYDLGDLDGSKQDGKRAGKRGKAGKSGKPEKGGKRATAQADGTIRVAGATSRDGLSSRLKGMKFMQKDTESRLGKQATAAAEASADAALSAEAWSLGLPSGPLLASGAAAFRCVADDAATPAVPVAEASTGTASVAAPGRTSYNQFNKALDTLVQERERASKRGREAATMADAAVSDMELAAALGKSSARAKGLSTAERRRRIRAAEAAEEAGRSDRERRKGSGKSKKHRRKE